MLTRLPLAMVTDTIPIFAIFTVLTLEFAPCIISRIGALNSSFFVHSYTYVFRIFIRLLIHTATVGVIRVCDPSVVSLTVFSRSTDTIFSFNITPLIILWIVTLY